MHWLDLVILVLAASRLTRLIVSDTITEPWRTHIWRKYPGDETAFGDTEVDVTGTDTFGRIGRLGSGVEVFHRDDAWYALHPSWLGNLISCYWCAGFWTGLVVWIGYVVYPDSVLFLAPFALSEAIGLLHDRN